MFRASLWGIFMPIVRETDCVPLPMAVCSVKGDSIKCSVMNYTLYVSPFTGQTTIGSGTQLVLLTMGVKMPETCWDNID